MAVILVIDDSEGIRDSLKRTLERAGFTVLTAENGNEGIKLFIETRVDLIITDILMPEKDGVETIIEMKKMAPDIKIIAMSGGGLEGPKGYLRMADLLGAYHTLTKPFQKRDLLDAVYDLLGWGDFS